MLPPTFNLLRLSQTVCQTTSSTTSTRWPLLSSSHSLTTSSTPSSVRAASTSVRSRASPLASSFRASAPLAMPRSKPPSTSSLLAATWPRLVLMMTATRWLHLSVFGCTQCPPSLLHSQNASWYVSFGLLLAATDSLIMVDRTSPPSGSPIHVLPKT